MGIVLDRYPRRLLERVQAAKLGEFAAGSCMEGVEMRIGHLHSLGYAHNDLNPMNIMLDDSDNADIIDFGSCRPFGSNLMSGGTPGWVEKNSGKSEKCHDEWAIGKIRTWIEEQMGVKREMSGDVGKMEG